MALKNIKNATVKTGEDFIYVGLGEDLLCGIVLLTGTASAGVTISASTDGTDAYPMNNTTGALVLPALTANQYYVIDPANFEGVSTVKLSGFSSGATMKLFTKTVRTVR
jgi:hypothetical protein